MTSQQIAPLHRFNTRAHKAQNALSYGVLDPASLLLLAQLNTQTPAGLPAQTGDLCSFTQNAAGQVVPQKGIGLQQENDTLNSFPAGIHLAQPCNSPVVKPEDAARFNQVAERLNQQHGVNIRFLILPSTGTQGATEMGELAAKYQALLTRSDLMMVGDGQRLKNLPQELPKMGRAYGSCTTDEVCLDREAVNTILETPFQHNGAETTIRGLLNTKTKPTPETVSAVLAKFPELTETYIQQRGLQEATVPEEAKPAYEAETNHNTELLALVVGLVLAGGLSAAAFNALVKPQDRKQHYAEVQKFSQLLGRDGKISTGQLYTTQTFLELCDPSLAADIDDKPNATLNGMAPVDKLLELGRMIRANMENAWGGSLEFIGKQKQRLAAFDASWDAQIKNSNPYIRAAWAKELSRKEISPWQKELIIEQHCAETSPIAAKSLAALFARVATSEDVKRVAVSGVVTHPLAESRIGFGESMVNPENFEAPYFQTLFTALSQDPDAKARNAFRKFITRVVNHDENSGANFAEQLLEKLSNSSPEVRQGALMALMNREKLESSYYDQLLEAFHQEPLENTTPLTDLEGMEDSEKQAIIRERQQNDMILNGFSEADKQAAASQLAPLDRHFFLPALNKVAAKSGKTSQEILTSFHDLLLSGPSASGKATSAKQRARQQILALALLKQKHFQTSGSVPPLFNYLNQENSQYRQTGKAVLVETVRAAKTTGQQDRVHTELVAQLATKTYQGRPDNVTRLAAIEGLTVQDRPQDVPLLFQELDAEANPETKIALEKALIGCGDQGQQMLQVNGQSMSVLAYLEDQLRSNPHTASKIAAVKALQGNNMAGLEPIFNALDDIQNERPVLQQVKASVQAIAANATDGIEVFETPENDSVLEILLDKADDTGVSEAYNQTAADGVQGIFEKWKTQYEYGDTAARSNDVNARAREKLRELSQHANYPNAHVNRTAGEVLGHLIQKEVTRLQSLATNPAFNNGVYTLERYQQDRLRIRVAQKAPDEAVSHAATQTWTSLHDQFATMIEAQSARGYGKATGSEPKIAEFKQRYEGFETLAETLSADSEKDAPVNKVVRAAQAGLATCTQKYGEYVTALGELPVNGLSTYRNYSNQFGLIQQQAPKKEPGKAIHSVADSAIDSITRTFKSHIDHTGNNTRFNSSNDSELVKIMNNLAEIETARDLPNSLQTAAGSAQQAIGSHYADRHINGMVRSSDSSSDFSSWNSRLNTLESVQHPSVKRAVSSERSQYRSEYSNYQDREAAREAERQRLAEIARQEELQRQAEARQAEAEQARRDDQNSTPNYDAD